jgi:hypothetical protein
MTDGERRPPAAMPATLEGLARSLGVNPAIVERLAASIRTSRSFRENADHALELLGGVIPD